MQPYFFPHIGYFQLIHAVDRFFLYDNLDYSRGGWINRNRILVVRGRPTFLSVPIRGRKITKTIRDTILLEDPHWRLSLQRSIHTCYSRSPYFRETLQLVEEILFLETSSLAEINKRCITGVCNHLGVDTEILTDSTPFDALEFELRQRPGTDPIRKVTRAIELCRALGADVFINAIGGRALYDKEVFARHGVRVFFVQTRPHTYPQRAATFHPSLSIIDVLMNCGRDGTRRLLGEYDLV